MDLRRRPEGAMAPLMEETTTNKAPKLLLEGAKITETTWKWPRTSISKGAKTVRPPQKNSWDPLLIRSLTFWPVDGRPHSVSGSMHVNGVTIYTTTHNHNHLSPKIDIFNCCLFLNPRIPFSSLEGSKLIWCRVNMKREQREF